MTRGGNYPDSHQGTHGHSRILGRWTIPSTFEKDLVCTSVMVIDVPEAFAKPAAVRRQEMKSAVSTVRMGAVLRRSPYGDEGKSPAIHDALL